MADNKNEMIAAEEDLNDVEQEVIIVEQIKKDNASFLADFNKEMNQIEPQLRMINVRDSNEQQCLEHLFKTGCLSYLDFDNLDQENKVLFGRAVSLSLSYNYGFIMKDANGQAIDYKKEALLNKVINLHEYFDKINPLTKQRDVVQIDWNDLKKAGKFDDNEMKRLDMMGYIEFAIKIEIPNGRFTKSKVGYFRVYLKGRKMWQFVPVKNNQLNGLRSVDTVKLIKKILGRCPVLAVEVDDFATDQELKAYDVISQLQLMLMTNNINPRRLYRID